jgi:thiaminase/transcriptional activator TenA
MTLSSDLWGANQDLAQACLEHPFVRGIATGTLPVSRFAYYVGQDTFFLQAFARAYCVAAAKAPDPEGFEVFHTLAGGAVEELKLHQGYAAEWGADLSAVAPAPATRRYVPPRHRLGGGCGADSRRHVSLHAAVCLFGAKAG